MASWPWLRLPRKLRSSQKESGIKQAGAKKRREKQNEMVISAGSRVGEKKNTGMERCKTWRKVVGKEDRGVTIWEMAAQSQCALVCPKSRGDPCSPLRSRIFLRFINVFWKKCYFQLKMWKFKTILSNLFYKIQNTKELSQSTWYFSLIMLKSVFKSFSSREWVGHWRGSCVSILSGQRKYHRMTFFHNWDLNTEL